MARGESVLQYCSRGIRLAEIVPDGTASVFDSKRFAKAAFSGGWAGEFYERLVGETNPHIRGSLNLQ